MEIYSLIDSLFDIMSFVICMALSVLLIWTYALIFFFNHKGTNDETIKIVLFVIRIAICVLFVLGIYNPFIAKTAFYTEGYVFTIGGLFKEIYSFAGIVLLFTYPAIVGILFKHVKNNTNNPLINKTSIIMLISSLLLYCIAFFIKANNYELLCYILMLIPPIVLIVFWIISKIKKQ